MKTDKLKEIIELQYEATSATTYGGSVSYWQTFETVVASIINAQGNRTFESNLSYLMEERVTFYLRYLELDAVKETRIKYNCKQYKITGVSKQGRNKATIIDCISVS